MDRYGQGHRARRGRERAGPRLCQRDLPFEDRCAAEAALTLLLDDPSSKVRLAMAEALSMSHHAPLQIISALASDQPEVASLVLARSPLLTDADLIDRVATGQKATQKLIADRPIVSMSLAAAIAEIGEPEACAVAARQQRRRHRLAQLSPHGRTPRPSGAGARGADRATRACRPTAGTCFWSSSARRSRPRRWCWR